MKWIIIIATSNMYYRMLARAQSREISPDVRRTINRLWFRSSFFSSYLFIFFYDNNAVIYLFTNIRRLIYDTHAAFMYVCYRPRRVHDDFAFLSPIFIDTSWIMRYHVLHRFNICSYRSLSTFIHRPTWFRVPRDLHAQVQKSSPYTGWILLFFFSLP